MDVPKKSLPRSPRRTLNIPKKELSPTSSYKGYVEHPALDILNQAMLYYTDMETIIKLYAQDHKVFETKEALDILAARFSLPKAKTFKELLKSYDRKYATVRSYYYKDGKRTPEKIILQAALEGNVQAMYDGFKLYPKLRNRIIYNKALKNAAEGGHKLIIDLLLELGADDSGNQILIGASKGGHLDILKTGKITNKREKLRGGYSLALDIVI